MKVGGLVDSGSIQNFIDPERQSAFTCHNGVAMTASSLIEKFLETLLLWTFLCYPVRVLICIL